MRYLFRGLIRETGRVVEGHVEGANNDAAINALADNGIVTESLTADPEPLNLGEELPDAPEFAEALESAFDSSSTQVAFDDLTERYRGKKVWVIDRDKIRRRVSQVVDSALALSHSQDEGGLATRERVATAIRGLFSDDRNIASQRNADSIAGMRFADGRLSDSMAGVPAPAPSAPIRPATPHGDLDQQIARLSGVVRQAEALMASLTVVARNIGRGGGGPVRRRVPTQQEEGPQHEVLLQIFKSNLDLVRSIEEPPGASPEEGNGASSL